MLEMKESIKGEKSNIIAHLKTTLLYQKLYHQVINFIHIGLHDQLTIKVPSHYLHLQDSKI